MCSRCARSLLCDTCVAIQRDFCRPCWALIMHSSDEGSQESLLDLMQSRQELYELLDYDPKHPERHRFAGALNPEEPT